MVQEWRVREARAGQRSLTASTVAAVSCSAGSQLARTGRSVYKSVYRHSIEDMDLLMKDEGSRAGRGVEGSLPAYLYHW